MNKLLEAIGRAHIGQGSCNSGSSLVANGGVIPCTYCTHYAMSVELQYHLHGPTWNGVSIPDWNSHRLEAWITLFEIFTSSRGRFWSALNRKSSFMGMAAKWCLEYGWNCQAWSPVGMWVILWKSPPANSQMHFNHGVHTVPLKFLVSTPSEIGNCSC